MEWISVKDRLPEPEQFVIYHAPGIFETGQQMWIGQCDEYGVFYGRSGFFGGGEVTYWMPLPEPPSNVELRGDEAGRPKASTRTQGSASPSRED